MSTKRETKSGRLKREPSRREKLKKNRRKLK